MECNCYWCFAILAVVLMVVKQYLQPVMWQADGAVMRGKTVIVTGANTGIGLETVAELARYGAKVIMACRDKVKAAEARKAIIERLKDQDEQKDIEQRLVVEELDLASFESIRAFAARMLTLPKLDVLINNAGVLFIGTRQLTKDGLEMTMGTNHFGHFLLTNLLLPLLKKSTPSRIIVVSSEGYKSGKIEFDNLNCEKSFNRYSSYCASKLANVLFTRELARKLEGTGVVVNALHPGVVVTEGARHFPKPVIFLFNYVFRFFFKSPLEGAQTTIYLAASQSPLALESGRYFKDCGEDELTAVGKDDATAKKLWEVSERITKLA